MKKNLSGNITVQAAVIIPVLLFVFGILMNMLFYYHDKNVVMAVAHDTASYGSYLAQPSKNTLEQYLEKQLRGKLFLFSTIHSDIEIREKEIYVCCTTQANKISLKETCSVNRTNPVHYIRSIRKAEKIGEEAQK